MKVFFDANHRIWGSSELWAVLARDARNFGLTACFLTLCGIVMSSANRQRPIANKNHFHFRQGVVKGTTEIFLSKSGQGRFYAVYS